MEEKKFCRHCGEQINKSYIICPKCGRELEVPNTQIINNENSFNKKKNFMKNNGLCGYCYSYYHQ